VEYLWVNKKYIWSCGCKGSSQSRSGDNLVEVIQTGKNLRCASASLLTGR
jgi:hypothetical protein